MKKHLFSFLFLLSLVFSVSAQKPSDAEKNLRTHVSYLASDQMEGRRTGERGATNAAGYVANMFANYKLKTGINRQIRKAKRRKVICKISRIFPAWKRAKAMFFRSIIQTLNLREPIGCLTVFRRMEILQIPKSFSPVSASLPRSKLRRLREFDVRNKTVAVFSGTPDGGNPRSLFSRFNIHAKAKIAQEKGAKAILIISGENDLKNEKSAQLNFDQTLGETSIPVIIISRKTGASLIGVKDEKNWQKSKNGFPLNPKMHRFSFANLPKSNATININLVKKQTEAYNVIGIRRRQRCDI